MNFLFIILCIIHIIVWVFILLAFLNPITAYYNVYYVIPIIYILHILPFHIIISLKKKIYTDDKEEIDKETNVSKFLIIQYINDKNLGLAGCVSKKEITQKKSDILI